MSAGRVVTHEFDDPSFHPKSGFRNPQLKSLHLAESAQPTFSELFR
jgi:hypothetical protein